MKITFKEIESWSEMFVRHYKLDYTLKSLKELSDCCELKEINYDDYDDDDEELDKAYMENIGCYIGKFIITHLDGWQWKLDDPEQLFPYLIFKKGNIRCFPFNVIWKAWIEHCSILEFYQKIITLSKADDLRLGKDLSKEELFERAAKVAKAFNWEFNRDGLEKAIAFIDSFTPLSVNDDFLSFTIDIAAFINECFVRANVSNWVCEGVDIENPFIEFQKEYLPMHILRIMIDKEYREVFRIMDLYLSAESANY